MEAALDLRQRGDDDRDVEHDHQVGGEDDREDQRAATAVRRRLRGALLVAVSAPFRATREEHPAGAGVTAVTGTGRATPQRPGRPSVGVWTLERRCASSWRPGEPKSPPSRPGLPLYGGNRRVAGLRRGGGRVLAGVSVDTTPAWSGGTSPAAPRACWSARPGAATRRGRTGAPVRPGPRRPAHAAPAAGVRPAQRSGPASSCVLDAIANAPAFVRNGRMDILAANQLGRALYSEIFAGPAGPANIARFASSTRGAGLLPGLGPRANDTVAILRAEAGRNPYDRGLTDLVGELSTRSEEFRTLWAAHNVRQHHTGPKHLHHPWSGTST